MRGLLDDYAYTAIACLDAYEITGDLSYFRFAQQIADEMIRRFADPTSGGFFDTEASLEEKLKLGSAIGSTQAIPGRSHARGQSLCRDRLAAPARLHQRIQSIATRPKTRWKCFAGVAEQFGIYAGTYGLAATWLARPHTQVS